ncbi:MAG: tRNA pseudouridine(55) synthase TruB [Lachnospiraceae bacterium]|nr:tRNA pseudouridine(55) synthase TruB [Lachnospiraceae bacterium]
MVNGVLNIYKEPGFTSHDVVAKLRGIVGQKKIGHTGTLDPDAEGVLGVCLGAATRICDMITDAEKEYEATLLLGVRTDTLDTSGQVLEERPTEGISEQDLRNCIESFTGEIEQIPPMYSAIKVGGKKLYEIARAGETIERKARKVTIHSIDIVKIDLPECVIRVSCSKGTYIRTLCDDIGGKLKCGGCMKHLIRTKVGQFRAEDALKLSEIETIVKEGRIGEILIPPVDMFGGLRKVTVTDAGSKKASNGNMLAVSDVLIRTGKPEDEDGGLHNISFADNEEFTVTDKDGFFFGIYRYRASDDTFKPVKMFLC